MFAINEDKSIYITRGDMMYFGVSAVDKDGTAHTFAPGDIIRFKVFGKKDVDNVVLQKDVTVTEETKVVGITLTGADTKIEDTISKPVDYWYEVELNPDTNPQTIIGYDDNGAKIFKLYPEGADVRE
jgi:hypothetical protein